VHIAQRAGHVAVGDDLKAVDSLAARCEHVEVERGRRAPDSAPDGLGARDESAERRLVPARNRERYASAMSAGRRPSWFGVSVGSSSRTVATLVDTNVTQ
jgi:hypothetical protein